LQTIKKNRLVFKQQPNSQIFFKADLNTVLNETKRMDTLIGRLVN
jgi:hypothetical protein